MKKKDLYFYTLFYYGACIFGPRTAVPKRDGISN